MQSQTPRPVPAESMIPKQPRKEGYYPIFQNRSRLNDPRKQSTHHRVTETQRKSPISFYSSSWFSLCLCDSVVKKPFPA